MGAPTQRLRTRFSSSPIPDIALSHFERNQSFPEAYQAKDEPFNGAFRLLSHQDHRTFVDCQSGYHPPLEGRATWSLPAT